jgi:hypothetical protein
MKSKQTTNIKSTELIADDKNFNKGSENGAEMIRKSFQKFGSGRSILIDKNNRIIAGNKSVEYSGIEDVLIVESDGTQLIAVKRTDIDLDSPQGREMALAELIEAELGEAVCEEWNVPKAEIKKEVEGNFDDEGIEGKNQYGVIVICESAGTQESVFNDLTNMGFNCKIVVT